MPSIKEIYNSIGEVELNADQINLNVDGLEALASTQQADIALIKADVDDIRVDLANGVTINQPVAVTDNAGSLTVDGSVSVSNFPATQPVSGTVTANAGTGTFAISAASLPLPSGAATSANQSTANTSLSNIDTDLGAQADASASSDTGTFSLISLFKRLLSRVTTLVPANLTVTSTRLLVDGSGVTQPVSDRGATGEATVSSFTSTTSATLKSSNSSRKLLTILNEGAGNLHVLYGSGTASTTNYSVKLFSGDYLEVDKYTGQINAIFSSAGTARVTEIT